MSRRATADDDDDDGLPAESDGPDDDDTYDAVDSGDSGDVTLDDDDLPSTHMSDAEYEAYAAKEFDAQGREKGEPPVAAILIGITLAVILLAVLLA
jgi:hypothetical protein